MTCNLIPMTAAEKKARADERLRFLEAKLSEMPKEIRLFYQHVPKSISRLFLEVFCGKQSKSDRIKLKCLDCSAWQRDEVSYCNVRQCALWDIRPYQKKRN